MSTPPASGSRASFLFGGKGWPYLLVPFMPIAIALDVAGSSATLIFATAALGIIPTAALMGTATEELAARAGPGIGGLLNVTFGNAPELIIAMFALGEGLHEVVKASIIGSVLGNVLLVLGAAMLAGGIGRDRQTFHPTAVSAQAGMLFVAVAALVMPGIFELVNGNGLPHAGAELVDYDSPVETLSLIIAGILLVTYLAGLVFSLRTHRDIFNPSEGHDSERLGWSVRKSVIALAIAGVLVGVMSEVLVGSISDATKDLGLSEFFVGVIIVAIVGNAAEHWVAVLVARKNDMDLAMNIAIGSSAQVALVVAPLLVIASLVIGPSPLALVFNGYELGAMVIAVIIAIHVCADGESNWFEGVLLLALYAVLGTTFAFA